MKTLNIVGLSLGLFGSFLGMYWFNIELVVIIFILLLSNNISMLQVVQKEMKNLLNRRRND